MRRITPPRSSGKQQYKNKTIPLTHLINSLMTTNSSEFYHFEGSPQRFVTNINLSRMQAQKCTESNFNSRPQTSRGNNQTYKANQDIGQPSPSRKAIRPKSSAMGSTNFLKTTLAMEGNTKQLNIQSFRTTKCQTGRNYNSISQKQQVKVEYKLVNADNPFSKMVNKPPKSIQSTKAIGPVRGYGVNSHKFHTTSEVCEGRILIIANLTKTSKIQAITSLYALFESNKSVLFLDYVRQQFQIQISKKLDSMPPPPITKQLIESCLHRIENKFCQLYNVPTKKNLSLMYSITNNFGLSYSIAFVRNDEIIICTKGVTHVKTSMNFGHKMQGQHSQNLHFRKISKQDIGSLDFIALVSEGLHGFKQIMVPDQSRKDADDIQNKKGHGESAWIQRQLWQIMMTGIMNRNQQKANGQIKLPLGIHELLGNSLDSLFSIFSSCQNSKNISIIIIGFRNMERILGQDENVELPYCGQINQISNTLNLQVDSQKDNVNIDTVF